MASPLGAGDAQGASSLPCLGCKGKDWSHGQAMGRATIDNKNLGRQASGTTGAQGAKVKITTQRACVSVRDARRAASWTGLMQFHCGAGNAPLQSRKLPISVPRAASARIYRCLDMASFYLWFRSDERGGSASLSPCHPSSNGVYGKASGSDALSGHWHCAVIPITAQCHWKLRGSALTDRPPELPG